MQRFRMLGGSATNVPLWLEFAALSVAMLSAAFLPLVWFVPAFAGTALVGGYLMGLRVGYLSARTHRQFRGLYFPISVFGLLVLGTLVVLIAPSPNQSPASDEFRLRLIVIGGSFLIAAGFAVAAFVSSSLTVRRSGDQGVQK